MNKWYSGEGKNSDVVVGATVRLARNLADAPFPIRMNNEIRRNTVKKIFAAVKNSPYAGEFDLVDLSAASSAQAYAYAEQQLISRRFARQKDQSAFLLSKDGRIIFAYRCAPPGRTWRALTPRRISWTTPCWSGYPLLLMSGWAF